MIACQTTPRVLVSLVWMTCWANVLCSLHTTWSLLSWTMKMPLSSANLTEGHINYAYHTFHVCLRQCDSGLQNAQKSETENEQEITELCLLVLSRSWFSVGFLNSSITMELFFHEWVCLFYLSCASIHNNNSCQWCHNITLIYRWWIHAMQQCSNSAAKTGEKLVSK